MSTRKMTVALLVSLAVPLCAVAGEGGGTLTFQGQIVEAGCTVSAVRSATTPTDATRIAPGINLTVADHNDACSRGYAALTSQYEPLISTDTREEGKVITITYN